VNTEVVAVISAGGIGQAIARPRGGQDGAARRPLAPEQEHALVHAPADGLLQLPFLAPDAMPDSAAVYGLSKRANHLRVQAAAVLWGDRGARVNAISPGIVLTPLAEDEMGSAVGPVCRSMIDTPAAGRVGTTDEIAAAAAFLLGPEASFITGSDLLIDGGVIAALRVGRLQLP
jgi:enoyl-[acyl-carrier-protein] reductase (NADH)